MRDESPVGKCSQSAISRIASFVAAKGLSDDQLVLIFEAGMNSAGHLCSALRFKLQAGIEPVRIVGTTDFPPSEEEGRICAAGAVLEFAQAKGLSGLEVRLLFEAGVAAALRARPDLRERLLAGNSPEVA